MAKVKLLTQADAFNLAIPQIAVDVAQVAAGGAATISSVQTGTTYKITFGVPSGPRGLTGLTPSFTIGNVTMINNAGGAAAALRGTTDNPILDLAIPRGLTGLTPVIAMGNVTTGAPGSNVVSGLRGTAENPILDLTIPRGATGLTPSFSIGNVNTGAPGSSTTVSLRGTTDNPILDLTIPRGNTGLTPAFTIGNITTTAQGTNATVGLRGTVDNPILDVGIPRGNTGLTPNITIGNINTGAPLSSVIVGLRGTAENPILDLTIPRGNTGLTPSFTIGNVVTGNQGTNAVVGLRGTADNPILDVTIPRGYTGITPNITMGNVTTLGPGSNVTASFRGTPENPILDLGIPRGNAGAGSGDVSAANRGSEFVPYAADFRTNIGLGLTDAVTHGDIRAKRDDSNGVYYFGGTGGVYLQYTVDHFNVNGGAFNILNGGIFASGNINSAGNVIFIGPGAANPGAGGNFRMRDDTGTERWLTGLLGYNAAKNWTLFDVVGGKSVIEAQPDGKIGMGTTTPKTRLHVAGGNVFNQSLSGIAYTYMGNADGGADAKYTYIASASGYQLFGRVSDDLATNTEYMRITDAGNVGIGTISPNAKFVVSDNGAVGLEVVPVGTDSSPTLVSYNQSTSAYAPLTHVAASHAFRVGRAEVVRIASGSVGIGTATPVSELDVKGRTTSASKETGAGVAAPTLGAIPNSASNFFTNDARAYGVLVGTYGNTGDTWFQSQRVDGTATAYNLNLQPSGGNVGIGTTTPAAKLHVNTNGANPSYILVGNGNNGVAVGTMANGVPHICGYAGVGMVFGTNFSSTPVEFARFDGSGNFGIGTNNPQTKLDVNGHAKSTVYTNQGTIGSATNARNHFTPWNADGSAGITEGWIAAAFGNASTNRVVIGQGDNKAIIAGHISDLTNWSDLSLRANNLSLEAVDGSSTLYVSSARNVGVNTTNPRTNLTVLPKIDRTDPTGRLQVEIGETTNNDQFGLRMGYVSYAGAWGSVINSVSSGGGCSLSINPSGGYVGVGTASPVAPFHVSHTSPGTGEIARFERTAGGEADLSIQSINAAEMYLRTNGTTLAFGTNFSLGSTASNRDMTIINGKVGIGNAAPTERLTVAGNIGVQLGGYVGFDIGGAFAFENGVVPYYGFGILNPSTTTNARVSVSGYDGIDFFTSGTRRALINGAGKLTLTAPVAATASLNIPHGDTPTNLVNGDIWTTIAGMFVRVNGNTVGPFNSAPRAMNFHASGVPSADETFGGAIAPYPFAISANNSKAIASVAATAATTIIIRNNGAQIGTITFAANATLGSISISTAPVAIYDRITLHNPSSPDATLATITILLRE